MNNDWLEFPKSFEVFNGNADCIMYISEKGRKISGNRDGNENKFPYSQTGIIINGEDGQQIISNIMNLKNKYWADAMFEQKRVVFNSNEINKKTSAFSPDVIDNKEFNKDLLNVIKEAKFQIITAVIDRLVLNKTYKRPYKADRLALTFLLERFVLFLKHTNQTGIVVLESKDELDNEKFLKKVIKPIIAGKDDLAKIDKIDIPLIKGMYFNNKRTLDDKRSYPHSELADIVSQVMHDKVVHEQESEMYEILTEKIINYLEPDGYGIKYFPPS